MVPAFGFSVGDFIAAIELCQKIARALKPVEGASSSFQTLVLELSSLEIILQRLVALEPTESNIDHVNAIRCMALACRFPLRQFMEKIEPYEAHLGFYAQRSFRAAGKKVKWTLIMEEEINKLRTVISAKVISINLLLALHASEAASRLEGSAKTRQEELIARVEAQRDSLRQLAAETSNVRRELPEYQKVITNQNRTLKNELHSRFDDLDSQTVDLSQQVSALSIGVSSNNQALISLQYLGSQVLNFIKAFPAELRDILQQIIRGNLQNFQVLLSIQNTISASPSISGGSSIHFEDALGVVRVLPFEWFRHWELPFYGLLQSQFADAPGHAKIMSGDFCLVLARKPATPITKEQWKRVVQPGAEIKMAMILFYVTWNGMDCPRPTCTGRPSVESSLKHIVTCPECGLKYSSAVSDFTEANLLQDKIVVEQQLRNDEHIFGTRILPEENIIEDLEMEEISPSLDPAIFSATEAVLETSLAQEAIEPSNDPSVTTPLLNWLDGVESPVTSGQDPLGMQTAESDREREKGLEIEEVEYFKSVLVNLKATDPDALPLRDDPRVPPDLNIGATVYYRTIMDRYPDMAKYLAIRLAKANWDRAMRLVNKNNLNFLSLDWANDYDPDEPISSRKEDSKERTLSCKECGRKFRKQKHLKRHVRTHYDSTLAAHMTMKEALLEQTVVDKIEQPMLHGQNHGQKRQRQSSLAISETRPNKKIWASDYWTGLPSPSRPASWSSSRNSSLHGYEVFDQGEQNMSPATIPRRGSSFSVGSHVDEPVTPTTVSNPVLPPPPSELGTRQKFECDICGQTISVRNKRGWKRHVMEDIKPYMCHVEECNSKTTYSTRHELWKHYETHSNQSSGPCLENLKDAYYECTICGKKLLDPVAVRDHQETFHHPVSFSMTAHLKGGVVVENHPGLDKRYIPAFGCDHLSKGRICDMNETCGQVRNQAVENSWFDRRYVNIKVASCPFCTVHLAPGKHILLRHLGRHLEEISFIVVRKPYEEWNFYQDSASEKTVEEVPEAPDFPSSLHKRILFPPTEDFRVRAQKLLPYTQDLCFEGDLYTPLWARGHGDEREGWCEFCKPGRWLDLGNRFRYDQIVNHGISDTGHPLPRPKDMRYTKKHKNVDSVWEGLCGYCDEWTPINSENSNSLAWFKHVYDCSTKAAAIYAYACGYSACTQRFETPQKLQHHRREHLQKSDIDNGSTGTQTRPTPPLYNDSQGEGYRCSLRNPSTGKTCNMTFSRSYDFERHAGFVHSAGRVKHLCRLCAEEKIFSRVDALARHMRIVHPETK